MSRDDRLTSKPFYALAVDIGGTKMAAVVIDSSGQMVNDVATAPVPFAGDGRADPNEIIVWIRSRLSETRLPLEGLGVSLCGNVDEDTGFVPLSPNLHWRRVPFGHMVQDATGLPVMAATDVRMAALAEAAWGAARGIRYFAWATIGTGYGGYLFLDGKLYRGFHGYAGNFGHNTWDEFEGALCGCGKQGCVETFVSGPGIARAGQQKAASGESPLLARQAQTGLVDTRAVFQSAEQGDPGAQAVLDEAQRLTAISLAGLVNILDLEMIVVGGGVANASPDYVQQLDRRIRRYLMTEEAKRDLRVVRESFANAALVGAAGDVFLRQSILSLSERL
jgi:glucokinase